jgi:hypothetical protein
MSKTGESDVGGFVEEQIRLSALQSFMAQPRPKVMSYQSDGWLAST